MSQQTAIHFAPLQGYTEDIYRRLHHQLFGGVDTYYTPFLRLEHGTVRSKDIRDVKLENNDGVPVIPQMIASDAKELECLLAVVLPMGYKQFDINMGCPFPLQTRHGRGAGILIHPNKVQEICRLIQTHTEVSFSVKMRLGLESADDWKAILPILNDAPLHHITLHPRIAAQQYKGQVNMQAFDDFLAASRHLIIYNGDIRSIEDIRRITQQYPVLEGVMIGRGLLANPALAAVYANEDEWDTKRTLNTLKQMHDMMMKHYQKIIPGEAQQLQKLRTFWDYLEPEEDDISPLLNRKQWKKIKKAGNMKNYLQAIQQID